MKKIIIFSSVILLFLLAGCAIKNNDQKSIAGNETFQQINCEELKNQIYQMIDEANYCQNDSECVINNEISVSNCDCGGHLFNKNADLSLMKEKISEYWQKNCNDCIDDCVQQETRLVCKNNKCEAERIAYVEVNKLSTNSQKYLGRYVEIGGYLEKIICTKQLCSLTNNACCNTCTAKIFSGKTNFDLEGNNCNFESKEGKMVKAIGLVSNVSKSPLLGYFIDISKYSKTEPVAEINDVSSCLGIINDAVFCQNQACGQLPQGGSSCTNIKGTCYQKCDSDADCPTGQTCATVECISGDAIAYQKVCK